jgi:hypothetical protein
VSFQEVLPFPYLIFFCDQRGFGNLMFPLDTCPSILFLVFPLFWVLWFLLSLAGFHHLLLTFLKAAGASSCDHDYELNLIVESIEGFFLLKTHPLTHFTVSNRCFLIYIVINSSSSSVYSAYRNLSVWSY